MTNESLAYIPMDVTDASPWPGDGGWRRVYRPELLLRGLDEQPQGVTPYSCGQAGQASQAISCPGIRWSWPQGISNACVVLGCLGAEQIQRF